MSDSNQRRIIVKTDRKMNTNNNKDNNNDNNNNRDNNNDNSTKSNSDGSIKSDSQSLTGKSTLRYQSTSRLPNPPSLVEYRGMRFVVMDAPSESNINLYLAELERHAVTDVVRVCDPTYPKEVVERRGIRVHDWIFPDGEKPPEGIVNGWLGLVEERFGPFDRLEEEEQGGGGGCNLDLSATIMNLQRPAVAVHCVAGLGRAPVLVAVALIEAGMSPLDAVQFVRERRRGAINTRQLKYLESYRRRSRSASSPKCSIQ